MYDDIKNKVYGDTRISTGFGTLPLKNEILSVLSSYFFEKWLFRTAILVRTRPINNHNQDGTKNNLQ